MKEMNLSNPWGLDLFCGAGGCTKGYQEAGYFIVGVDIELQKRYVGDGFIQADALDILRSLIDGEAIVDNNGREWRLEDFSLIHASPPCQVYSVTSPFSGGGHPDLVNDVRELLIEAGRPYVIENVPGAPLENPLVLCGTMFGLRVIRHRLFECKPTVWFPPFACSCKGARATGNRLRRVGMTRTPSLDDGFTHVTVVGNNYLADEGRLAMGIDWMTKRELSQAIPPLYTEYIGRMLVTNWPRSD